MVTFTEVVRSLLLCLTYNLLVMYFHYAAQMVLGMNIILWEQL